MAWPRDAYVGQKVVAIKEPDDIDRFRLFYIPPRNVPLTIASIHIHFDGEILIDLIEYPFRMRFGSAKGFRASAFRPIQDTEKGMEVLRGILRGAPVKGDVLEDA